MLDNEQKEFLRKQLEAGTAPPIAGAMLGAKTMQELEANKQLAYEFAIEEKLIKKVDVKEQGDK